MVVLAIFKVIKPGVFTTIQDLGRTGYQKYGLAVSGSADHYSHRIANLLLGNLETAAVLEVTLMGLKLKVLKDTVIAVTGGDLTFTINEVEAAMWTAMKIKQGDMIQFKGCRSGCRAYLSVLGGISVPKVLGSRSTDTIGQIGGIKGRALRKEDMLYAENQASASFGHVRRRLPKQLIPTYLHTVSIRVILGPQEEMFKKEAIDAFFSSTYRVTTDTDRMGCRLEGTKLTHKSGADIYSEGIFVGAIQVPKSGQPIIFLVGRRSIGGHTKIGGVITVDLPKLAQVKPGDNITFEKVTIEEAHDLLKKQEHDFSILKAYSYR